MFLRRLFFRSHALLRFSRPQRSFGRHLPPPLQSRVFSAQSLAQSAVFAALGISVAAFTTNLTDTLTPRCDTAYSISYHKVDRATARLKQNERDCVIGGQRFHSVSIGSNSPMEDAYAEDIADGPGNEKWVFWGVFDGHGGSATSTLLRTELVQCVSKSLQPLPTTFETSALISTIKEAFVGFDSRILQIAEAALNSSSLNPDIISALAPAYAGSCAVLSLYNPRDCRVITACVGDCRAVLGRYNSSSATYTCEPLSVDQTGKNPKEVARVRAEHPEEPDCINEKNGRVLGLEPTRAFGDSLWKWDSAKQRKAKEQFFGEKPLTRSKTPPYVTAEPEVTETFVGNGDFLILASDGLWDHFSSEDAVACVEQWMKAARENNIAAQRLGDPVAKKTTIYVREEGKDAWQWKATPEHFVFEDTNAATHLARNAFGGSRRDLFYTVMNTEPPLSRTARDDITVTIVFFGDIPRRA